MTALPTPSSSFEQVRVDLAGKLQAAGLAATVDPATGLPFVLVDLLDGADATAGIGGWPARATVWLVAAPPGNYATGRWLEQTLQTVLQTLGPSARWYRSRYQLDDDHDAPAYEVTYPVDVPDPNC